MLYTSIRDIGHFCSRQIETFSIILGNVSRMYFQSPGVLPLNKQGQYRPASLVPTILTCFKHTEESQNLFVTFKLYQLSVEVVAGVLASLGVVQIRQHAIAESVDAIQNKVYKELGRIADSCP